MLIREVQTEDASAIARLLTELGYPVAVDDVLPRLERLRECGDLVLIAEVDGDVAGLAQLHVSPSIEYDRPAAKLGALVVQERHRRSGIGRALVGAIEAEARSRGCGLLFLTTAERRADAHAFYARLGFERTGRRYAKRFE
ncbi:MAG TPA: GNAT family N-acetyltransferase [Gaiellaceae bacterium]|nr:GNAT family N-acetyltransferase [Gaiellaceae bacterium]